MKVLSPPAELTHMAYFLLEEHEAMTIATIYRVTPSITDTVIIAATDKAAALFGFESGEMMVGQAVSTLHHLEDMANTRKRAIMRSLGAMPMQDDYPMRIIRPNGEEKGVIKHVTMKTAVNSKLTLWISRHESRRTCRATPPLVKLIPEAEQHEAYHHYTIAEVEYYLQKQNRRLGGLTNAIEPSRINHDNPVGFVTESHKTNETTGNSIASATLTDLNGRIIRSRKGTEKRLCVCYKCNYTWLARKKSRPRECPECHSWTWDDPVRYGPRGIVLGTVDDHLDRGERPGERGS